MVALLKHQKSNFIRMHLIKEIFQRCDRTKNICRVPGNSFVYFDEPIQTSIYRINRFGKGSFFFEEQVLPIDWMSIDGKILLKALDGIKKNKVFVLKDIDGRPSKTRIKNVRK